MAAQSPGVPTTIIRPRSGWRDLGIRELLDYRELGSFLVWRDLKVRYKQTAFGAAWAVIQPLGLMLVFTLFLERVSGIAPADVPYPLFAYAALVPWTFFAAGLLAASSSLVDASNLLQKVYFPRLLLPLAASLSHLVDLLIALVLVFILMGWYGVTFGATLLALAPLILLTIVAALGFGIWLAAINVRYRDVRYAVPFLVQLLLLASPVAYASTALPEPWRALLLVNPMTGIAEGFRWAILGTGEPPVGAIALSTLVATLLVVTGALYFRRTERTFADVI